MVSNVLAIFSGSINIMSPWRQESNDNCIHIIIYISDSASYVCYCFQRSKASRIIRHTVTRAKLGAKRLNGIIASNLGLALSPLSTGNQGNQVDKSFSYGVVAILIMLHPRMQIRQPLEFISSHSSVFFQPVEVCFRPRKTTSKFLLASKKKFTVFH